MQKRSKPQKQPKGYGRRVFHSCDISLNPQQIFHENTHDIARTLVEILAMSGIHRCKASRAKDIMLDAFSHYDEERHGQSNAAPCSERSFAKTSVIRTLGSTCMMTYAEALFTYSVMKQLLKAFFASVPKCGIRNYIMEAQRLIEQRPLWDRVGKRLVNIFKEYEYFLTPIVKNYSCEIKFTCNEIFNRMKDRIDSIEIPKSTRNITSTEEDKKLKKCPSSTSFILGPKCCYECPIEKAPNESYSDFDNRDNGDSSKHVPDNTDYPFEKFPHCFRCHAPKPFCICHIDPVTGKLNLDCSQGPFRCEWYHIDKEYRVKQSCHVCPIDCWDMRSTLSDPGDECSTKPIYISEDDTICEYGDSSSDIRSISEKIETETETICDAESTSEEFEPVMDGREYCCHNPIVNLEPILLKDKVNLELEKHPIGEKEKKKRRSSNKVKISKKNIPAKKEPRKETLSHQSSEVVSINDNDQPKLPHKERDKKKEGDRKQDEKNESDSEKDEDGKIDREMKKKKESEKNEKHRVIEKKKEGDRKTDEEIESDSEKNEDRKIDREMKKKKEGDRKTDEKNESDLEKVEEKESHKDSSGEEIIDQEEYDKNATESEAGPEQDTKTEEPNDPKKSKEPEDPKDLKTVDKKIKDDKGGSGDKTDKDKESGEETDKENESDKKIKDDKEESGDKTDKDKESGEETDKENESDKKIKDDKKESGDKTDKDKESGEETEKENESGEEKHYERQGEENIIEENIDYPEEYKEEFDETNLDDGGTFARKHTKPKRKHHSDNNISIGEEISEDHFSDGDPRKSKRKYGPKRKSKRIRGHGKGKIDIDIYEEEKVPEKTIPKKKKKLPCCPCAKKTKSKQTKQSEKSKTCTKCRQIKWKCVVVTPKNRIVEAPSIC